MPVPRATVRRGCGPWSIPLNTWAAVAYIWSQDWQAKDERLGYKAQREPTNVVMSLCDQL